MRGSVLDELIKIGFENCVHVQISETAKYYDFMILSVEQSYIRAGEKGRSPSLLFKATEKILDRAERTAAVKHHLHPSHP